MANPQPDKFTKISNEIMEHLMHYRIPGEIRLIFDTIIRQTWGYGKKEDYISLSQFVEKTHLQKSAVIRGVTKLLTHKLIYKSVNARGCLYSIQKDFDQWIPFTKLLTSVYKSVNLGVTKVLPTKETITKETITKEKGLQATGELLKKRKDITFPYNGYKDLNSTYAMCKGILPKGDEWLPILQTWKTMLKNGRTIDEIKEFMHWLAKSNQKWTYGWTHRTVNLKIAEYLAGTLEETNFNSILRDPIFKKYQEVYFEQQGNGWALKEKLSSQLNSKYPGYKYEKEWKEANQVLRDLRGKKEMTMSVN